MIVTKRPTTVIVVTFFLVFTFSAYSYGALFEQLAVSTKASTLGNAVTAYPPGPMSIHYNPAGLTKLEGTHFNQGVFWIPVMAKTGKFKQGIDPDTGEYWAPFGGYFNPLNRPEGEPKDPLHGTEGTTDNGTMILPIIGDLPVLIAPDMGVSYSPPGSRWTFGIAQYVPFGVGMEHADENDPNRFIGSNVGIQRLIVAAPAVAYQLSDTVSVGVSTGIGINAMKFTSSMRTPNDMVALTGALGEATENLEIPPITELTLPPPWFGGGLSPYEQVGKLDFLCEDFFTTSYNLGFLWEPNDWFAFGAVYQSQSETDMSGHYEMEFERSFQNVVNWLGSSPMTISIAAIFALPYRGTPLQEGTMTIDVPFPARTQFGIMLRPIERLRLLCDLNWTEWGAWENMEICFDQDIQLLQFARMMGYQGGPRKLIMKTGFENTWHLGYGLEFDVTKQLALRLGYEKRPSSVPDEWFGPVPMPDMEIYSIGLGLNLEDARKKKPKDPMDFQHQLSKPCSIDVGFTWLTSEYKLKSNTSKNFNSTNFTIPVYNPFAGLDYEQKITSYVIAINANFKW
ncbi:MAG: outer membrane protein transport protein [Deltaproteobacteria bacterium]|nr:outer membrane protein transport protein [Deltaproteobacteria bacterium]